jgi:hypothetical protein
LIALEVLVGNSEGKRHYEDLDADGRIIIKKMISHK